MTAPDICHLTDHGFVWGSLTVERTMRLPERGRVVHVLGAGSAGVEVYVSNGGRSVRVFKDGRELK